jgi:hypothetical protein
MSTLGPFGLWRFVSCDFTIIGGSQSLFFNFIFLFFETNERELSLQKSNQTTPKPVPARAGHRMFFNFLIAIDSKCSQFQRAFGPLLANFKILKF